MTAEVLHGDCLELLPTLASEDVGAVITDPPYGIGLNGHGQLFKAASSIKGDDSTHLAETIYEACAQRRWPLAMFFSPHLWLAKEWRSVLVWSKGIHVGAGGDRATCWKRDAEMIGVAFNKPLNGKRDSSVLQFNAISPNFVGLDHPAEKPVRLMMYLVEKLTQPGDLVIDPFMGVGSTGVACVKLGRNFAGIEKDAGYCEIARKRIAAAQAEHPLFSEVS